MIVVGDANNDRIQVFHPNGTFAYKFGGRTYGGSSSFYPQSVAVSPLGDRIAMAGDYNRLLVAYPNGTFDYMFRIIDSYHASIRSVAYSPSGDRIAVVDCGSLSCPSRSNVKVYYPNGTLDFEFGRVGDGRGQFHYPYSVAYSPDGDRIAVVDHGNHRVQLFHADNGTLAGTFGSRGSGNGQFEWPYSVAYSPDGSYIAVADESNNRIQLFHADNGAFADKFGSRGSGGANLRQPQYLAWSPDGNHIAVAFYDYGPIQLLYPNGTLAGEFGSLWGSNDGQFASNTRPIAYFP